MEERAPCYATIPPPCVAVQTSGVQQTYPMRDGGPVVASLSVTRDRSGVRHDHRVRWRSEQFVVQGYATIPLPRRTRLSPISQRGFLIVQILSLRSISYCTCISYSYPILMSSYVLLVFGTAWPANGGVSHRRGMCSVCSFRFVHVCVCV